MTTLTWVWRSQEACPARQQQRAEFVSPIKKAIELASLWVVPHQIQGFTFVELVNAFTFLNAYESKQLIFRVLRSQSIKKEHTYIT